MESDADLAKRKAQEILEAMLLEGLKGAEIELTDEEWKKIRIDGFRTLMKKHWSTAKKIDSH